MKRDQTQNPYPSQSYADYSGYESKTPRRLDSRDRYRHDRDQNPLPDLHGREPSYRAMAELDHSMMQESERTTSSSRAGSKSRVDNGTLSYEEQYRTDGEAHNYSGPLEEDRYGEYPRYGKAIHRMARKRKSFAGVGPKGYKRSDERIEEEVCEVLAQDEYIDASEIVVGVEDGVVMLSGTVPERQDRFEAELLIEKVLGVEDIVNDIRVKKQQQPGRYQNRQMESRH